MEQLVHGTIRNYGICIATYNSSVPHVVNRQVLLKLNDATRLILIS
jgi:hypothetical protein